MSAFHTMARTDEPLDLSRPLGSVGMKPDQPEVIKHWMSKRPSRAVIRNFLLAMASLLLVLGVFAASIASVAGFSVEFSGPQWLSLLATALSLSATTSALWMRQLHQMLERKKRRLMAHYREHLRKRTEKPSAKAEAQSFRKAYEQRSEQLRGALDLNKRQRAQLLAEQARLAQRSRELVAVIAGVGDALIMTDAQGRIVHLSRAAADLVAYNRIEALNRPFEDVVRLYDATQSVPREHPLSSLVTKVLDTGSALPHVEAALMIDRHGGSHHVVVTLTAILNGEQLPTGLIVRLVSGTPQAFEQRETMAERTDSNSGLRGREAFNRRLDECVERARVQKLSQALLLIRFDNMANVHDVAGYQASEEVTWRTARIIEQHVGAQGECFQVSATRFGVLLKAAAVPRAGEIAETIRQHVAARDFRWKDQRVAVTLSLVQVPINAESDSGARLLEQADRVLVELRRKGGNATLLQPEQALNTQKAMDDAQWTQWVQPRLVDGRAHLITQEIHPLDTDGVASPLLEAYFRMEDDDGTWVAPGAFLPVLERRGMSSLVDIWMLRTLLEAIEKDEALRAKFGFFSLNVSLTSLEERDFIDQVQQLLLCSPLAARQVCFELDERGVATYRRSALRFVQIVQEAGARVALDQCRAGLGIDLLRELPVNYVKVHESLIKRAVDDPIDHAQLEWLNTAAHRLNIRTVACGVEDRGILSRLREMGFDLAQGIALNRIGPLIV